MRILAYVPSEPTLYSENMWKGGLTSDHEDYISRNCRKYDGDKLEEKDGFAGVQRDGNFAPELGSHSLYCSGRENLARGRKRGEGEDIRTKNGK